jgi:hypothetical protein
MTGTMSNTMTIADLIESLQDLIAQGTPEDTVVMLGSNYGDHCNTHQALVPVGVKLAKLKDSAYSDSGKAVVGWSDEDEDEEAPKESFDDASEQVVLITSVRE